MRIDSPPRASTSASLTSLTTCWAGLRASWMRAPTAASRMRVEHRLDDHEVDVGLEEGEADLAQHLVDVGLAQRPLAAQPGEDPLEAIGKRLEHESHSVSGDPTGAQRRRSVTRSTTAYPVGTPTTAATAPTSRRSGEGQLVGRAASRPRCRTGLRRTRRRRGSPRRPGRGAQTCRTPPAVGPVRASRRRPVHATTARPQDRTTPPTAETARQQPAAEQRVRRVEPGTGPERNRRQCAPDVDHAGRVRRRGLAAWGPALTRARGSRVTTGMTAVSRPAEPLAAADGMLFTPR